MQFAWLASSALASSLAFAGNKENVRNFYEMAFVQHRPAEAMKKFMGERYIQHNPRVKDGKEAFIAYFEPYFAKNPQASTEIKRIIADGDFVVVHAHSRANPEDLGYAAIDIFRLEKGKIVEHWDSVQNVPKESANANTMF